MEYRGTTAPTILNYCHGKNTTKSIYLIEMTEEDLPVEPYVLSTEKKNHTAEMTISMDDEDHKFDVWQEGDEVLVEYQESLSYRAQIRVSEPDEDVFKALMVSDEMTRLLNEWGVSGVRRAEPTP